MILLDTHIWVWWVHGSDRLSPEKLKWLGEQAEEGLAISTISCWEIAKLVEYGRLHLSDPLEEWLNIALVYPGLHSIELTPRIVVESTQLPGEFHRDPADQIIVATARVYDYPLLTVDQNILEYAHVKTLAA